MTSLFYKGNKNTETKETSNTGNVLQLSTLMAEDTTQTCAMSSYSYVLFRNVSVSLRPETLCWEKHKGLSFEKIRLSQTTLGSPAPKDWRFCQGPTCSPCTEESRVRARQREELGCSFPSCLPEIPHQWIELVLHMSKTRSIVLSLLGEIRKTG